MTALADPTLLAALPVSLEKTGVFLVTSDGIVAREAVAFTEPEAIAARRRLEAGLLSAWLVRGLAGLGIEVVLMEMRQIRAALSAMIVKTDCEDGRRMAQLLHFGWFWPVHAKMTDARELRTMLAARTTLVARLKDIENSVRGLLRGFAVRLPKAPRGRWEPAVRDLLDGHSSLLQILAPLLLASEALREQLDRIDRRVRDAARADAGSDRLMSAPDLGVIVAPTYRAAVYRPERFRSSKQVGTCFGPTPRKYQSGETDRNGAISRAGDASVWSRRPRASATRTATSRASTRGFGTKFSTAGYSKRSRRHGSSSTTGHGISTRSSCTSHLATAQWIQSGFVPAMTAQPASLNRSTPRTKLPASQLPTVHQFLNRGMAVPINAARESDGA